MVHILVEKENPKHPRKILGRRVQKDKKAELGFWLLPENWGKGYMSEAMPLIFDHAFNEIGLHRIEGFVESKNTNCKKALAKLEFTLEGTMRDCEIKDGNYVSRFEGSDDVLKPVEGLK